MSLFTWGKFRAEVDETVTRRYYTSSPVWDCTCGHCRNFLALARRRELPGEVLRLLDGLSIPPEKATYVCELYHEGETLYYEVAYRLSGRVLAGPERAAAPFGSVELLCGQEDAPGTAGDFPTPRFDLIFYVWLPWALDEPIEGQHE
jgi:hypothetical protein